MTDAGELWHGPAGGYDVGMAQFHFDPDSYLELMLEEVPEYERLQEETLPRRFQP